MSNGSSSTQSGSPQSGTSSTQTGSSSTGTTSGTSSTGGGGSSTPPTPPGGSSSTGGNNDDTDENGNGWASTALALAALAIALSALWMGWGAADSKKVNTLAQKLQGKADAQKVAQKLQGKADAKKVNTLAQKLQEKASKQYVNNSSGVIKNWAKKRFAQEDAQKAKVEGDTDSDDGAEAGSDEESATASSWNCKIHGHCDPWYSKKRQQGGDYLTFK